MGKSTISNVISEVCTALWNNLHRLHMRKLTSDSLVNIAQEYYLMWDVPHCVGGCGHQHDAATS